MPYSRTEQREIKANNGKLSANSLTPNFKQGFQARFLSKQTFYSAITPHFNLKEPKSEKPTTVYFVVWIDKKQHRINTGCKVYPKYWADGRAMESRNIPVIENRNNCILNDKIDEMCIRFDEYKYYVCSEEINHSFKKLKEYMANGEIKEEKTDIIAYMKKAVYNDTNIKESTRDNYMRFIGTFEEFYKQENNAELTTQLFKKYQNWCVENVKGAGGKGKASTKTINEKVKNILTIINRYLVFNEIISAAVFKEIQVMPLKEKDIDDEIALMDDEVMKLYKYQCKNKKDEEIRDLFVLECTTGQRISDIDKVASNVETKAGRTYINIVQDKTNEKVQVDIIFEVALEIIKKYDYKLPTYDRSTYNKRIKEIAKEAGIKGVEDIRKQLAGEREVKIEQKERWECVSSHTGRRTFITLLSLRGWNYNEIARYSGHTTLDMVQRYDKSKKGTKVKKQYEDLKEQHPELILKLIGEKKEEEEPKEREVIREIVMNPNYKENQYAIDREVDISGMNLSKEEIEFINNTNDYFAVGSPSLKIRKIIDRLKSLGIVVKLSE